VESRGVRYSLLQDDKRMLEKYLSAGERPGTYIIVPSPYPCADVMIAANCEGVNTADPQIAAGSTFSH
jgi:hypothetical protein